MKTLRLCISLSVLLSFLLTGAAAQARPFSAIDQSQPIADETAGVVLAIGGGSGQKLAQTVTVELGGRLLGVFLPVICGTGELVIEIRALDDSAPGDVVLAKQTIPADQIPLVSNSPVFRFFELHGGNLSFALGDRYAIVLQNPTGSCSISQGPLGDSYGGGQGFFDAAPNPPGWVLLSGQRVDLPFMTLMRLATP